MGNSNRGTMSNGSDGSSSITQTSSSDDTVSSNGTSSNGSDGSSSSIAKTSSSDDTVSSNGTSIAQTSSNGTSVAQTSTVANNTGISISHRGGHGGTEKSRKDNKGVHLAES